MMVYLAVATGGALGAVSRYFMMSAVTALWPSRLPVATLLVNALGGLAIGIVYVLITEKMPLTPEWRGLLIAGYLGSFTTFSTFSLDTLLLLERGQPALAGLYVIVGVSTAIAAAWLGMVLARLVVG